MRRALARGQPEPCAQPVLVVALDRRLAAVQRKPRLDQRAALTSELVAALLQRHLTDRVDVVVLEAYEQRSIDRHGHDRFRPPLQLELALRTAVPGRLDAEEERLVRPLPPPLLGERQPRDDELGLADRERCRE